MPQLDRIIIFTQIFWLFVIFTSLYIILTHFFLPIFLKSLKSRNLIIENNISESIKIQADFSSNQILLNQVLNEGLFLVKTFLSVEFLMNNKNPEVPSLKFIDIQLVHAIFNTMLHCDDHILDNIPLTLKIYNSAHTK